MKKLRNIIITVVVIVIVLAIAKKVISGKKNTEKVDTVRIEQIQRSELNEFVTAPGQIEPKTKVDISAKVAARVVELPFEEGDRVTKGNPGANPPIPASVLIRLDSKDLESNLRSAQASHAAQAAQIEVEKARISSQKANLRGTAASLEQAKRDFDRQKQLLESRDISQSAYDQSKYSFDELTSRYQGAEHSLKASELNLIVMQHNLEAAAAGIEQAEERLEYTIIRSPMDGIITRIDAEVGEVVMTGTMNNPGTVIMKIADLSKMILVAQVDEANIGKLKVGQLATVRVQAFWDDKFTGIIDNIALSHDFSDNRTKYYKTEILLEGDVGKLYSGLTADVDIETEKHTDIIKVPSQAVLARKADELPLDIRDNNPNVDMDKTDCLVVYRYNDGKAMATPIKIGPSDMTHTIIESGISENDKIIVGPYKILESIKHDQKVRDEREVEKEKKEKEKEKSEEQAKKEKKS